MRTAIALLSISVLSLADGRMPRPELPDALRGFAGELVGTVVATYDVGFTIQVTEVASTWDHSKATDPSTAVGRTLVVNLRWEQDDDGAWRMAPRQVAWLRGCVKAGDRVRVDLANREGERLYLMELSEEQHERVDKTRADLPKPSIPDGLRGFRGTLAGIVRQKGEYGFVFHVVKVVNTWKGNRAEAPESAVGKDLLINAQWRRCDDGEWRPMETHVHWIGTLEVGEDERIEVVNDEGDRLHILELDERQRKAAEEGR